MFKIINCVLVFFVILSLGSCASRANSAPEWVTNPESLYSSKEFLFAVGSGASKKSAENDALSLLARSIQQNIVTTSDTRKTFAGSDSDGFSSSYDHSASVTSVSQIKDIPGVSFPQSWIAPNSTAYVLAVLNREEAGRFYRQKINDLSVVIGKEIVFASENEGTFGALFALRNASEAAWENQGYIEVLAGIHPDMYRLINLDYVSPQAVDVLVARQQEKIHVEVEVEGDSNNRLGSILDSAIASIGITSAPKSDEKLGYILRGQASMEPLKHDSKYEYVRFVMNVELLDKATDKTLLSFSKNGREAHVSYNEAVQRAYRTIEEVLKKEFVPQLNKFAQEK